MTQAVSAESNMPASFAISIAIPEGLAKTGETLEPAWYMLDANGTLRAGIGRGATKFSGDIKQPRIIRQVARHERERLYAMLRNSKVLEVPSVGQSVGDAQNTLADQEVISTQLQGAAMVGVWWTVNERRRSFVMVPVQKNNTNGDASDAAEVWSGVVDAVTVMREWMWKTDTDSAVVVR